MSDGDVVYVAVAPREPLDPGLAEKVASILNKDLFGTRVLLNSRIPRIFGRYPTLQEADSIADRLRALNLVTVVCTNSELLHVSPQRFRAHSLNLKEEGVTFWDTGHQERVIAAAGVLLILRGTAQTQVQKETTRTRRELNIAATVITGGIPITRKVVEKTKEESRKTEEFVRIYGRKSSEPMVEILQTDFDYASLGPKKAFSSLENMNIVVAELRRVFPAAVFDSRLTKHFGVDVPFVTPQDETEINSKLVYLCCRAVSSPAE